MVRVTFRAVRVGLSLPLSVTATDAVFDVV